MNGKMLFQKFDLKHQKQLRKAHYGKATFYFIKINIVVINLKSFSGE